MASSISKVLSYFWLKLKEAYHTSQGGLGLFLYLDLSLCMFLYYFHERAWNKIPLGRVKPPANDYQI